MCGIFGIVGSKSNAPKIAFKGLKSLEYRGYDSWGVVSSPSIDTLQIKKRTGKIGSENVDELDPSPLALGHTRWATHGGVTENNAHPHFDCAQKIALIHNGIIENYESIKSDLINSGHRFISETDSEVAVHLIEELYKKHRFDDAVRLAFLRFEGLNAIVAVDPTNQHLVAVRNGSPLVVGFGKSENFVASDASGILPYTKLVHFLEDGQMAVVSRSQVSIYDAQSGELQSVKPVRINWKVTEVDKGKYPHFMLKEIYEQPQVITQISKTPPAQIDKLSTVIKSAYGTYLTACGSASYAGLAGVYLFSKLASRHINWAIGSEFGYHLDFLTPKSLVIALSQSGETMDTLEAIKKAKDRGAKVMSLVNVMGSTLYRESDFTHLLGAGVEKGVASTKAMTAKIAHLVLLASSCAGNLKRGVGNLRLAVKSTHQVLSPASEQKIRHLANKLKDKSHIYVLGRGLSYPASLEVSLKIKEISYIHAEGYAAGELKHGVIALIEPGTPCLVYLPDDETFGANLAASMEVKARGAFVIGVSKENHEVFDYHIPVQDAGIATIIPNIVVGQLLAYHLAVVKRLDPDMPRNLAKSVTVK